MPFLHIIVPFTKTLLFLFNFAWFILFYLIRFSIFFSGFPFHFQLKFRWDLIRLILFFFCLAFAMWFLVCRWTHGHNFCCFFMSNSYNSCIFGWLRCALHTICVLLCLIAVSLDVFSKNKKKSHNAQFGSAFFSFFPSLFQLMKIENGKHIKFNWMILFSLIFCVFLAFILPFCFRTDTSATILLRAHQRRNVSRK